MKHERPLPAVADPHRSMPAHAGARLDAIETALRVLGEEDARLQRLGLDGARDRNREVRRFWGFVGALHQLAATAPATAKWEGGW